MVYFPAEILRVSYLMGDDVHDFMAQHLAMLILNSRVLSLTSGLALITWPELPRRIGRTCYRKECGMSTK